MSHFLASSDDEGVVFEGGVPPAATASNQVATVSSNQAAAPESAAASDNDSDVGGETTSGAEFAYRRPEDSRDIVLQRAWSTQLGAETDSSTVGVVTRRYDAATVVYIAAQHAQTGDFVALKAKSDDGAAAASGGVELFEQDNAWQIRVAQGARLDVFFDLGQMHFEYDAVNRFFLVRRQPSHISSG